MMKIPVTRSKAEANYWAIEITKYHMRRIRGVATF